MTRRSSLLPSSLGAFVPSCLRAFFFLACVPVCLSGCSSDPSRGYSFRSTYGPEVRSISVPVFDNQTFYRGMEVELTDAIIKEIQRSTPWVVTQSSAQTTLTGTITENLLRDLSLSTRTGLVQEVGVQTTVDFEWTDARTGKPLVSRKGFKSMEAFVPAHASGERLELGQHAVVQELARGIVAELRASW